LDIGTHLREARERRDIPLKQIADTTKLSIALLRQIEQNEFDRLPGGLFRKGYIRTYAAEVGVDAVDVVRAYTEQYEAEGVPEMTPMVSLSAQEGSHSRRRRIVLVCAALVLAVVGYAALRDVVPPPLMGETLRVPAPPASPLVAGVVSSAVLAAEQHEWGLYLEIEPAGDCWVSVVADGERVVYRLIQAGERTSVTARDELVLRIGQPGHFDYTLNGVPGRSLGAGFEPVTVTITRDNYESFVTGADGAPLKLPVSVS